MHEPQQLAVWRVDEGPGAQLQFRAMQIGGFIAMATEANWEQKTLDELTPPKLLPLFREASEACVDSGCAVYTILRSHTDSNQAMDLERLLLPFGTLDRVENVVASLQLVSLDMKPERGEAKAQFERNATEVTAWFIPPSRRVL